MRRRVFVSSSRDEWLDERRRQLKHGIIERIRQAGYEPQFFDVPGDGDLVSGKVWNLENVEEVMRRCVGVVVVGLARWAFVHEQRNVLLPSEYCHYEGSLARAYQLPILALVEGSAERRGIFIPYGLWVLPIPLEADASWLGRDAVVKVFDNWKLELEKRRDVFLGYCGSSTGVARNLIRCLRELELSVLDWQADFAPGGSILAQIQEASARCSAGIFLFTRDDEFDADEEIAAPRDNVVFEAGFFAHAKGKERVLIIREKGAKMPADLGGDIYASLEDRSNIEPLKPAIARFVEERL
jgi:hypothetical protein